MNMCRYTESLFSALLLGGLVLLHTAGPSAWLDTLFLQIPTGFIFHVKRTAV